MQAQYLLGATSKIMLSYPSKGIVLYPGTARRSSLSRIWVASSVVRNGWPKDEDHGGVGDVCSCSGGRR